MRSRAQMEGVNFDGSGNISLVLIEKKEEDGLGR